MAESIGLSRCWPGGLLRRARSYGLAHPDSTVAGFSALWLRRVSRSRIDSRATSSRSRAISSCTAYQPKIPSGIQYRVIVLLQPSFYG